ncbi:MAG: hypothetical protein ACREJQ_04540, partial [bacterium]
KPDRAAKNAEAFDNLGGLAAEFDTPTALALFDRALQATKKIADARERESQFNWIIADVARINFDRAMTLMHEAKQEDESLRYVVGALSQTDTAVALKAASQIQSCYPLSFAFRDYGNLDALAKGDAWGTIAGLERVVAICREGKGPESMAEAAAQIWQVYTHYNQ